MTILRATLALGVLAVSVCAQDPCARPQTTLPSNVVGATTQIRVCAPKEDLPPVAAANLVHTGQVVYAIWEGPDAAGTESLFFRRSTTGGCDWEAEQLLWQNLPGEGGIDNDFQLVCHGYEVWIVLTIDRLSNGTPSGGNDHVWVLASDRQGATGTWTAIHVSNGQETVLPSGDQGADVDAPKAAAKAGSLHVVFEYDYVNSVGAGNVASLEEDVWYQRVDFTAPGTLGLAFPNERKVESTPTGVIDTDFPNVACLEDVVVLTWMEDRTNPAPGSNSQNDTYVRVSTDGGVTFGPEENLTNLTSISPFAANRESKPCVFGQAPNYSVAVFCEDSRNGTDDDIYLYLSTLTGATGTFTGPALVSQTPAGVDSDGMEVCCTVDGKLYVAYEDDRLAPGNANNRVFVVADQNGGADFLAGTQIETQVSEGDAGSPPFLDGFCNVVAVFFVDNIAGNDPARVSFSCDLGATWQRCDLFDRTGIDADGLTYGAVTTRGDLVGAWTDDRLGGNALNSVHAGGTRVPFLTYDDPTLTFTLRCSRPGLPTDAALLLVSITAPACGAFPIDPSEGWQNDFSFDAVSASLVGLPFFIASVDANGNATFPGIPNLASVLGFPFYWTAAHLTQTADIVGVTDTLTQN